MDASDVTALIKELNEAGAAGKTEVCPFTSFASRISRFYDSTVSEDGAKL
jgi:hypothetical protein